MYCSPPDSIASLVLIADSEGSGKAPYLSIPVLFSLMDAPHVTIQKPWDKSQQNVAMFMFLLLLLLLNRKVIPLLQLLLGYCSFNVGPFPSTFQTSKASLRKGFSSGRIIMMMKFTLSWKFSLSLLSLFMYACGPLWRRAIGKSPWSSLEISFRAFVWEGERKRNKGGRLGRERDRGGDTGRRLRSEEWEEICTSNAHSHQQLRTASKSTEMIVFNCIKLWAHWTQKNWSCYECM